MLDVIVPGRILFNEATEEFVETKDTHLKLEHSLMSLSKWESKWHKPFLGKEERTEEELLDYIRCMTIMQNVDQNVYLGLSQKNIIDIKEYMEDPMTATWFNDKNNPKTKQRVVTAELIYYWMFTFGIPLDCEKWHLNRLLTLIRVCNVESAPKKKMKAGDIMKQNRSLNEARKRMMNSRG